MNTSRTEVVAWRRVLEYVAFVIVLALAIDAWVSFTACQIIADQAGQYQYSVKHCGIFDGPFLKSLVAAATFFEDHSEAVTAAFTIVLAVSTIGLWLSTYRLWQAGDTQILTSRKIAGVQARQTRQAIREARRSADASKHSTDAFMTAEKARLITEIKASTVAKILKDNVLYDGTLSKFDEEVDTPSLGYYFVNIGRTPAVIKELSNHLVFAALSPEPDLTWYAIREQAVEQPVILPGKESSIFGCLTQGTMTLGKCVEFHKRRAGFWFYGYVKFDDVFGREHEWRWRFFYRRGFDGFRLDYFREFPGPGGQTEAQ
jgi:hypothetical protein